MVFKKIQPLFRECKDGKIISLDADKIIFPLLMFISVSKSILIVKLRVSFVLL